MPFSANGSVVINEIMYNLEDADKGREWIEILNNGNNSVDLSGWKFYESETNHKIKLFGETGDFIISADNYAIIADNPEKFLIDWPNFSGIIFDSSFSLKNSGENLILKNNDLENVDEIFYASDWGGNGDGNSLQKINNEWISANPTPGITNFESEQNQEISTESEEKQEVINNQPEPEIQQEAVIEKKEEIIVLEEASIQPTEQISEPKPKEEITQEPKTVIAPKTEPKIESRPEKIKIEIAQENKEKRHAPIMAKSEPQKQKENKKIAVKSDLKEAADVQAQTQTASAITAIAPNKVWGIKEWIMTVLGFGIFCGIGLIFIRRQNTL